MISQLWMLVRRTWPLWLALAVALIAYRQGFQAAFNAQQVVIERAEKDKTAALLESGKAFAAELERVNKLRQAQADKTYQTGIKLAAANAETNRLKQKYKKGITYAIEQDKSDAGNACIDGLGANSLYQYKQALGYGAN